MNPTTTAPRSSTAHVTGWDRAAVVILGGAGCALSFSALQQMALAIHIRPALCWLFPLVIDGFIAYGIRALLVLRTAPLRARLYVWLLFGTATAVSLWSNALHAVRLNQEPTAAETALRLGDTVTAVLSTVAPLALAGAVHLYILIARGPHTRPPVTPAEGSGAGHPGILPAGLPVTATHRGGQHPATPGQDAGHPVADPTRPAGDPTGRLGQVTSGPLPPDTERAVLSPDTRGADARTGAGQPSPGGAVGPRPGGFAGGSASSRSRVDLHGHTGAALSSESGLAAGRPVAGPAAGGSPVREEPAVGSAEGAGRRAGKPGGRPGGADTEELLRIARSAVNTEDKLTRKVVAQAIRGQRIPLSNDTLTDLMARLREQPGHLGQPGQPVTTPLGQPVAPSTE